MSNVFKYLGKRTENRLGCDCQVEQSGAIKLPVGSTPLSPALIQRQPQWLMG